MFKFFGKKDLGVRILLGLVVAAVSVGMLLYLVPGQGGSSGAAQDVVARVGDQPVTILEIRERLQRVSRRGAIPPALEPLYARQILEQLVYQRMLEMEAKRLGIRVTDEERAERIRQLLPTAFVGDTFVGMERYAADVQTRFDMSVPEFEELVRQGLLEEKFRHLVTDGVTVTPEEVALEFKRRSEKIRIEFVVIKPNDLESKVPVNDADLSAYFEKNKSRYVVPERRVARYALLDLNQLRARVQVSDDELRAYYNEHVDQYRVPNRVHVEHILFKTVGKTDAEIEEVRKKAEDVLKRAKQGANFEELARKYSEDTTREKGGDLGWIVPGQTVPEFETTAFSLPKGGIGFVKTIYGFHIIKVLDRENAHTRSFEEVRGSILPILAGQRADQVANQEADKIAGIIRQSGRQPVENLARQFNLMLGETRPVSATDILPELGNSPEVRDAIFRLRQDDLSLPIRIDRGYVVLSVKPIDLSHQGTLAEVRDQVIADYRREKAAELARTRAEELAKRAQSGENFAAAAKALEFDVKVSEPFARTGSVPDAGSARQLAAAFSTPVGQTGQPIFLGLNWVVCQVTGKEEPKPEEFEKERKDLERQVLQSKRELAYEAFRAALEARLRQEGKLKYVEENLKRLSRPVSG